MNLKTWFKGLGVFVASSFITSLAAANLSPSTFNFSKQGLSKLATLAAIVGIKAVVLYLKQSPLPANGAAVNWTKISGALVVALALPLTGLVSGCVSSWEQDTYAALATGKALIDCAVAGYNHADGDIRKACAASEDDAAFDATKFYIAQTRAAQQAIETARQAQVACVEAFEAYAVAKVAKDKTVSLAQKRAAVAGYLAQLPELLDAIRALLGSPTPPTSHPMTRNTGAPRGPRTQPSSSEVWRESRDSTARLVHFKLEPIQFRSPDHPITGSPDTKEVSHGQ